MIEIYNDQAGQWRYRVKGKNGEPMAASEAYGRKTDAIRGARSLILLMQTSPNIVQV